MIPIQSTKTVLMTPPQLKDDGDLASNTYVDTLGYAHLRVIIATGTMDEALGSTAEGTAVYLEECDTTDGSYDSLSSTPGALLADAIAATEDDSIFIIDLDLRGRKRYIEVNAPHAGNGTTGVNACIIGILSKAQIHPDSATEAGAAEWIKV